MARAIYAVIMAGGQGTRFWPVSRGKKPKQFLALGGTEESLIQATARRIEPLTGKKNVLVVTNAQHAGLIREHVPEAEILCEPAAKNTAAAIALAAIWIGKKDPDALMVVLPADHAVRDEKLMLGVLNEACELAAKEPALVTVGIKPRCAHTGYGYIKRGFAVSGRTYSVARFYEKPNAERAKMYFESGDYYWNSGMFVWRAKTILDSFTEEMPELAHSFLTLIPLIGTPKWDAALHAVYEKVESTSIDFGVLEHVRNCMVVAADDFGWNDVGSWDAWAEHFAPDERGNLVQGDGLVLDGDNCVVSAKSRFIAVLGAKDLVIIDSGDALLVCPRDRVQDIRKIVDELKQRGRTELV